MMPPKVANLLKRGSKSFPYGLLNYRKSLQHIAEGFFVCIILRVIHTTKLLFIDILNDVLSDVAI